MNDDTSKDDKAPPNVDWWNHCRVQGALVLIYSRSLHVVPQASCSAHQVWARFIRFVRSGMI